MSCMSMLQTLLCLHAGFPVCDVRGKWFGTFAHVAVSLFLVRCWLILQELRSFVWQKSKPLQSLNCLQDTRSFSRSQNFFNSPRNSPRLIKSNEHNHPYMILSPLLWERLIQSKPSFTIYLGFVSEFISHLLSGLPSDPFASDFPTKTL